MTNLQDISLPAQARAVYKLLLQVDALTAADIGRTLGVFPNAVYRSVEKLKKLGCVVEEDAYPAKFRAIAPSESVERFLLLSREGFLAAFTGAEQAYRIEDVNIAFIKDRDALLQRYVEDTGRAAREINLIISGHELPAGIHHENLKALKRGVKIRTIIQNLSQPGYETFKNWEELGIEVRYSKTANIRLVAIDRKVVHLLSYDRKEGLSGLGLKFTYAPFGEMMAQIFEDRWAESSPI